MLFGMQVALDKNELKDGGSFRRTRILAEVEHQAGSAHLETWEYAYGNWVGEDSIHGDRKSWRWLNKRWIRYRVVLRKSVVTAIGHQ